jgi:hypothetical protein
MLLAVPALCCDGCRSPNLLRRSLESRLRYATRKLRSDLQFLSEHQRRRCDASQSGEVQRVCRKIGRGSRVGDGPRQIRIRVGKADARRRPWDLERPRRRWALLGILDRTTKQLGRNHPEPQGQPGPNLLFRGWAGDGSASRQDGSGQACRPYLSVTAAATNFLRPALPGLVPWAAHQSGNVAGSM